MPEYDAVHLDADRINAFCEGHTFSSARLNRLGYDVPGTSNWSSSIEVMARSRGKEICIAMRAAGAAGKRHCPTCAVVGRATGSSSQTCWFPKHARHTSEPPSQPPPAAALLSDDGKVALLTMQRVMDGEFIISQPSQTASADVLLRPRDGAAIRSSAALLTLRRDDGGLLAFVSDTREHHSAAGGRPPLPGRLELGMWSARRSPDPLYEHAAFRARVLSLLACDPRGLLSKPICELLLDQDVFNGVGNYLRAEILHRASIPPFESSRVVLEELREAERAHGFGGEGGGEPGGSATMTLQPPDLLSATRQVLRESVTVPDSEWHKWLQCYDGAARKPKRPRGAPEGVQPADGAGTGAGADAGAGEGTGAGTGEGTGAGTGEGTGAGALGSFARRDSMRREIFFRGPAGPLGKAEYAARRKRPSAPGQSAPGQSAPGQSAPVDSPAPPVDAPVVALSSHQPATTANNTASEPALAAAAEQTGVHEPGARAATSMGACSGRPWHLDEIAVRAAAADGAVWLAGRSVRVLGVLTALDHAGGSVTIAHRGASLTVDMRLLESATPLHVGDWLQAIGELLLDDSPAPALEGGAPAGAPAALCLRARVCRNVNGLNVGLYEKAIEATREFERELFAD